MGGGGGGGEGRQPVLQFSSFLCSANHNAMYVLLQNAYSLPQACLSTPRGSSHSYVLYTWTSKKDASIVSRHSLLSLRKKLLFHSQLCLV